MQRRPVQLVLKSEGPGVPVETLIALCSDGSIWALPKPLGPPRPEQKWQRLPDVPGGDDK